MDTSSSSTSECLSLEFSLKTPKLSKYVEHLNTQPLKCLKALAMEELTIGGLSAALSTKWCIKPLLSTLTKEVKCLTKFWMTSRSSETKETPNSWTSWKDFSRKIQKREWSLWETLKLMSFSQKSTSKKSWENNIRQLMFQNTPKERRCLKW